MRNLPYFFLPELFFAALFFGAAAFFFAAGFAVFASALGLSSEAAASYFGFTSFPGNAGAVNFCPS